MDKKKLRKYIREILQQEDSLFSTKQQLGLLDKIKQDIDLISKDIKSSEQPKDVVEMLHNTITRLQFLQNKIKTGVNIHKSDDEYNQYFNKLNLSKIIDEDKN